MGTFRAATAALLFCPVLALSGCVMEKEGVPVPAPESPWSILYKAEGGPYKGPYWTRIDFYGRGPLVQADGSVRESLVFEVQSQDEPIPLGEDAKPRSVTRYVVDAESGLMVQSSWTCYDPPPNYHCLPNGSSIRTEEGLPFLWASSLAWGRTFVQDVPQTFETSYRPAGELKAESAVVELTWKHEEGVRLLVVDTQRDPHASMKGMVGDFDGTIRFAADTPFPHQVAVSRLGKSTWDSLLTAKLVDEGPFQPPAFAEAPDGFALPPADRPWTGPLAPGVADLELEWGGTPGAAWDALEANEDFRAWRNDHPDPFATSMPGSSGGGGSSCFLPDSGCPVNASSEGFEFWVGATDGARAMADVEWSHQEVLGVPTENGNESTFTPYDPEEASDPRAGRLFMDGAALRDVACSLDAGCDQAFLWRLSIDDGAYAYFTWEGPPNPHVDPMALFRLDDPRLEHVTMSNEAAEAFLGPL